MYNCNKFVKTQVVWDVMACLLRRRWHCYSDGQYEGLKALFLQITGSRRTASSKLLCDPQITVTHSFKH